MTRTEARGRSRTTTLATARLAALAGLAAVYVTLAPADNAGPGGTLGASPAAAQGAQASSGLPSGPGANPLSKGDMAAFVFKPAPEPLPEIAFLDGDGQSRSLKDWRGKVVLLNLWATWCAPCRKEMPDLDRLNKELGGARFEVVALAVDRAGAAGAKRFLDQIKVESLKLYVDPTARAGAILRAVGMPTTILLDAEGREIGRLVGPAEWGGADAKRLIEASLR
jgi:thiol-disulfide isomerase/thioredoxin